MADEWAEHVAREVQRVLDQTPQTWLDPRDYGEVYHYSPAQAGHILRRAHSYGALERAKVGRRFVYRPAGQDTPPAERSGDAGS